MLKDYEKAFERSKPETWTGVGAEITAMVGFRKGYEAAVARAATRRRVIGLILFTIAFCWFIQSPFDPLN